MSHCHISSGTAILSPAGEVRHVALGAEKALPLLPGTAQKRLAGCVILALCLVLSRLSAGTCTHAYSLHIRRTFILLWDGSAKQTAEKWANTHEVYTNLLVYFNQMVRDPEMKGEGTLATYGCCTTVKFGSCILAVLPVRRVLPVNTQGDLRW